ncbi:TIGR02301 family protein [Allorhizobium taibaishanense]|uniref:TIGR02301 family protein n=1 Tax=Allorhizobium taibaishanense TaxID=887144 RepID=A0A1Q9A074_9HYPH|nr:TIGR02301 family protein [Allorhizobium taibaishanense]MBB4007405.1 uncharacterized protein (TIGR02301 family) [Allorhizobium taibaishanense]OLP47849.1 TIGR02301 family protein [Allorhizobium taibaishanense]
MTRALLLPFLAPALLCLIAAAPVVPSGKRPGDAPSSSPAATSSVAPAPSVPYDRQLTKLSEILGTVTYLRNLCAGKPEPQWRAAAEKLIALDAGNEPARQQALTAAYNRGYRAFAAIHASCTSQARLAESQYRAEGATLVREMTARFGN